MQEYWGCPRYPGILRTIGLAVIPYQRLGAGVLGMSPVSWTSIISQDRLQPAQNMYKSLVITGILDILGIKRIVCVSTGQ